MKVVERDHRLQDDVARHKERKCAHILYPRPIAKKISLDLSAKFSLDVTNTKYIITIESIFHQYNVQTSLAINNHRNMLIKSNSIL